METKKSIKISLGTAVCICIIILLIIALAVMCLRYNNVNNSSVEADANKNVVKDEKQDKEWINEEKGIALKYPEEWTLKTGEDYMSKTIIEAPAKSKNDTAKIYVAVYRYFEKSSISDILEEITKPEDGVQTEELNSEEKNINISGLDTESKIQVITYDNGDEYKTKTLVCMNDSIVYEFVYTGETDEYEKYYEDFEKILETVEIYNIESEEQSDFQQVNEKIFNYLTENKKDLIYSKNKIEEIAITEIEIYKDKYFLGNKFNKESYQDVYDDENLIIGSCKYALKVPDQEGLQLAGSGGVEKIGNWIIITKLFIIEKDTNKVELCTGF